MKNGRKIISAVVITFAVTVTLCAFLIIQIFARYSFTFEKLHKIMNFIETSYVGEYDPEKCEEGAINGLLQALGDNYAVYYDEENAKETMQMIDGYYIGIGVEVFANNEKGYMEVISAFEDSPAYKAGIKSGDLIKSIDGKVYSVAEMADAVLYIKGANIENPLEKVMEITLIRDDKEITVRLNREKIDMYKVKSEIIDNICYIRYTGFTGQSFNELKNIIENLDGDIEGIVIDIRDNPGGEFTSAIKMCDLFLDDELIMYTVDKNGEKSEYYATEGKVDLPLAILVNGSSASASEIFAGSMKANKRALIVGEATYGKGVSQTVKYLNILDKSEGALKLTTCKNYTPDGKWINERIIPDIEVENSSIESDIRKDASFIEAVKSLKKEK